MTQANNIAEKPSDVEPGSGTVYQLLQKQSAIFADNPLLVLPLSVQALWQGSQSEWTYQQTLTRVDQLKNQYAGAGYHGGHRVALLLQNRPEHFLHWLALNALGVSVVPVNPDYQIDELGYLLTHSECTLLVCLPAFEALASAAAQATQTPVRVLTDQAFEPPMAGRNTTLIDDECAVVYTSGTTGKPKGCLLTNGYFLGWAVWYGAQQGLISLRPGQERLMTPLPAFHVNAMGNSFMGMLGCGGAQIIVDRFHPRSWWQTAVETKASCFHYLGVMPAIFLELPPGEFDQAHSLRFGLGGGVFAEHHQAFEERFAVPLLEGWAMTETGGAGILCDHLESRLVGQRCIGQVERRGPPLEVQVIDERGQPVATDQTGELVLRATANDPRKGFFSGYLKDAEATEAAWLGGWLHSGDLVRCDQHGKLFFVDRLKNIIRRSGENIAAAEVESILSEAGGVAQAIVLAMPDPIREEEVMAIMIRDDQQISISDAELAKTLFNTCAEQLSYFKVPAYLIFVDALPVTSTQKIRRAALRQLWEAPANRDRRFDFRPEKQALRPS